MHAKLDQPIPLDYRFNYLGKNVGDAVDVVLLRRLA
jgi:hypothetical protein